MQEAGGGKLVVVLSTFLLESGTYEQVRELLMHRSIYQLRSRLNFWTLSVEQFA
jgi:hypothetical protein